MLTPSPLFSDAPLLAERAVYLARVHRAVLLTPDGFLAAWERGMVRYLPNPNGGYNKTADGQYRRPGEPCELENLRVHLIPEPNAL